MRFGFADGYHDAVSLRDRSRLVGPHRGLRAGAVLHTLEGIVRADSVASRFDDADRTLRRGNAWHDSYEAEQHVHHYGPERRAGVLVAGRIRQRLRQRVSRAGDLFPRVSCLGQGGRHCAVVGGTRQAGAMTSTACATDFQSG